MNAFNFHGLRLLAAGAALAALAGCATGPNADPRDPLEPMNRAVYGFNDGVDRVVLRPVATVYRDVTPRLVRTGVTNFFANLGDAWSFVNNLLQFKGEAAGDSFMRFNVNTFMGLGGVLDVASEMRIARHKEDFGQTLGYWGVPSGPYVVLPILGPSTVRDTTALPLDWKGDLANTIDPVHTRNATTVLRAVNVRANLLRAGDVLDGAALDKYSFTRDVYLQVREADVQDRPAPAMPAGSADDEGKLPE
jgi:phospholipid-binding lipoprotein MlaA